MQDQNKEQIIKILQEIRPEFSFETGGNFIENGMLDSFDVVLLVTAIEEKFGILIDGLDIIPENFSTIEAIEGVLLKNGLKQ